MTQKPISPVLLFKRVADPKNSLSTSAGTNYEVLVPSDTPVMFEVHAPGYHSWRYNGELELKSNETKEVNIQLLPER